MKKPPSGGFFYRPNWLSAALTNKMATAIQPNTLMYFMLTLQYVPGYKPPSGRMFWPLR